MLNRLGEAWMLSEEPARALAAFGQAREALQHALEFAERIDTRVAQTRALLGLSELALTSGDPGEAIVSGQRAAVAFREMRMPLYEARADAAQWCLCGSGGCQCR